MFYHNRSICVRTSLDRIRTSPLSLFIFRITRQRRSAFDILYSYVQEPGRKQDMNATNTIKLRQIKATGVLLLFVLIAASPAHAFRCGNKIVIKNMHEQQVLNACGEPTTIRHLGYAVRNIEVPYRRRQLGGLSSEHFPGFGYYTQEVVVTEFVYNFGPRKFMRRLVFEGGVLISIETIGYGYIEASN